MEHQRPPLGSLDFSKTRFLAHPPAAAAAARAARFKCDPRLCGDPGGHVDQHRHHRCARCAGCTGCGLPSPGAGLPLVLVGRVSLEAHLPAVAVDALENGAFAVEEDPRRARVMGEALVGALVLTAKGERPVPTRQQKVRLGLSVSI